jgi:hypothetical protein
MRKAITNRMGHAFAIAHILLWVVMAFTMNLPAGILTNLLLPVYVVLFTLDFPVMIFSSGLPHTVFDWQTQTAAISVTSSLLFLLLGYAQWFLIGWCLSFFSKMIRHVGRSLP